MNSQLLHSQRPWEELLPHSVATYYSKQTIRNFLENIEDFRVTCIIQRIIKSKYNLRKSLFSKKIITQFYIIETVNHNKIYLIWCNHTIVCCPSLRSKVMAPFYDNCNTTTGFDCNCKYMYYITWKPHL